MNTLQQLSGSVNVFVNFFNSINRLFCQIRWLDRNLRNSSTPLLLLVGAIGFICYLVYATPDGADGVQKMLVDQGPLVIVCVVVVVLLFRRYTEGGNNDNNINSVMFGNPANNSPHPDENRRSGSGDIEMGRKIDPPKQHERYVQPAAVKY